jgi:hypothetical protein
MRFETVFLYLYDVGRSVDLEALEVEFQRSPRGRNHNPVERRLDTPESLLLPTPLVLDLEEKEIRGQSEPVFRRVRFRAKVYEEGVVTIECRAEAEVELPQLHTLRSLELSDRDGNANLDTLSARHFDRLMTRIQPHVNQDQYRFDTGNREDYHVFCLLDPVPDPQAFLDANSEYLARFLLGENPRISLHVGQISTTMRHPFSFTDQDVAIFDMDRAFLIAPNHDYDDLLLIIEHANYQLLELRALDKLLDRLLDDAERDVRGRTKHGTRGKRSLAQGPFLRRSLSQKLGNLQPLRLDALFILENLENSSRIIGDYYLEQIYDHLCGLFNTQGWKRNVEKRLEILQSIYTLTKNDRTDSTMVLLEFLVVIMIGVELIALFVPLMR